MSEHALARPGREALPPLLLNPYEQTMRYAWRFSVSQVETWRLCRRKWGFKILNRVEASNPFAERGKRMHAIAEDWLIDGVEPDLKDRYGALFDKGRKYLPAPGVAEVERDFEYISRGGIRWIGKPDVAHLDARGVPHVYDHKTASSYKWAHTRDTLPDDLQAALYALVGMSRYEAYAAELSWIYYKDQKKPAARCVAAPIVRSHAENVVDEMDETAFEIATEGRAVGRGNALALPTNAAACNQKGGCPYQHLCGLSDGEKLEAIMEQQSLRDRIQGGGALGPAQAAGPRPFPFQPAPQSAPQQPPMQQPPPQQQSRPQSPPLQFQQPQQTAPQQPFPQQPPPQGAVLQSPRPQFPFQQQGAPQQPPVQQGSPVTTLPQSARAIVAAAQARPAAAPAAAPADQGGGDAMARLRGMAGAATQAVASVPAGAPLPPYTAPHPAEQEEEAYAGQLGGHEAGDVNPPEQPTHPIDDPERIDQQGESKKRGRAPKAAAAPAQQGGDAVFAGVYACIFALRQDHELACEAAADAVRRFRQIA